MFTTRINPILVTGSHRSGTTWGGKMIALSWYAYYLEEPFNLSYGHIGEEVIPHQFHYVQPKDEAPALKARMDEILALGQPFHNPEFRYRIGGKLGLFKTTRRFWGLPRPLLKDPIAVFSTAWLAQNYGMDVIPVTHGFSVSEHAPRTSGRCCCSSQ